MKVREKEKADAEAEEQGRQDLWQPPPELYHAAEEGDEREPEKVEEQPHDADAEQQDEQGATARGRAGVGRSEEATRPLLSGRRTREDTYAERRGAPRSAAPQHNIY